MLDIKIRIRHPESNGIIERFHRSLREEGLSEKDLANKYKALDIIEAWVIHYNQQRLHSALGYLTPKDYLEGKQEERRQNRREKLRVAAQKRREENRKRLQWQHVKEQDLGALPPNPQDLSLWAETV